MATLTLRQTNPASGTNKGAPLTNAEVDANFNSLDTSKLEKSGGTLTGNITLVAGTTSVSPLRMQSGTNLTTPQSGALEFDGSNLFFTPVSTRKTVAFTDSNITGTSAGWTTGRTITLTGDVTGTSAAFDGTGNISITTTISADATVLGTDTTGNYVASITNGSFITGGNGGSEGAALTLAVDATSANTASKVVARDASGNFSAGTVTVTAIQAGSATGATSGQIRASGDIVAFSSSDERLKMDVRNIPEALDKVLKLNGVLFTWDAEQKDVHGYEGQDTGVIAQQVEAVLPEVVATRDDGFKAVKYEKMIGLLIEAIKELDAKVSKCTCNK